MEKNSAKKAMQLQERPKVGEYYKAISGTGSVKVIKVVKLHINNNYVHYNIYENGTSEYAYTWDYTWDWTKYYCEKLTELEMELL